MAFDSCSYVYKISIRQSLNILSRKDICLGDTNEKSTNTSVFLALIFDTGNNDHSRDGVCLSRERGGLILSARLVRPS